LAHTLPYPHLPCDNSIIILQHYDYYYDYDDYDYYDYYDHYDYYDYYNSTTLQTSDDGSDRHLAQGQRCLPDRVQEYGHKLWHRGPAPEYEEGLQEVLG
jgi:hypothetical protein